MGSTGAIANAVKVMDDPTNIENISRQMGKQHKVRNFYNNIASPNATGGDVTIDTHAIAADLLQPLAGSDAPVQHNFGSGVTGAGGTANSSVTGNMGTYGIHANAYRKAAADRDILPRQMQSITWEAVRGLFNNKSPKMKQAAADIWKSYSRGHMTQEEAQNAIYGLANGIDVPSWARD